MALMSEDAEAADIADLFGVYYANPTTAAKLVILTADVQGDTKIWAVTNTSGTGVGSISEDEIRLIGILEEINNFEMAGFVGPNFI
jgi:hypothetical protein